MTMGTVDDLIRLMAAMRELGVTSLEHDGLKVKLEGAVGLAPVPTAPPALATEQVPSTEDKVPVSLELEAKERQLDEMRLMDPYEYEQAILREDMTEK